MEQDPTSNQLFIDQIGLSLLAHFAQTYGGMRPSDAVSEEGLAPWQERRAKEIMRARFASNLTIADVAAECKLTPSHFARSFRRSTGVAPHEFLSQLRIEEAKRLMLSTKLPLADVALICGFGDQSYFTRVFSRIVGASPGAWRRARSEGLTSARAWLKPGGSCRGHRPARCRILQHEISTMARAPSYVSRLVQSR